MKLILTFACLAVLSGAKAQSASLGFDSRSSFIAVEYPIYQAKAFHDANWKCGLDADVLEKIAKANGLGFEGFLEKRFWSLKVLGITLASASFHFGFGIKDFAGEKVGPGLFFGLSGKV